MKKLLLVVLFVLLMGVLSSAAAHEDLPSLSDLPAGEWTRIVTGEETTCALGTEYSFFVRPGTSDNLLIYFQGGGACWNDQTCLAGYSVAPEDQRLYDDQVAVDEISVFTEGIFDYDNAENPFADYSAVFVPYCSGDVFTGSKEVEFTGPNGPYTVSFNGVNNARAVLHWTYENFAEPGRVFVTGSSAGAYGAIYHGADIMTNYDEAPVTLLGDAGVGVTPRAWEGLATWGLYDNLPEYIPDLANATPEQYSIRLHYSTTARAFPENMLAMYTTWADQVQIGFYFLQGGGETPEAAGGNWVGNSRSVMSGLQASLPNFAGYTAWGGSHTIVALPEFYTYQVGTSRVRDWVAALAAGEDVPDILCSDCNNPDLYEGE